LKINNIFKFNTKKNHISLFSILIIFLSIALILNFINTLEVFASNSDNKEDIVSGVVPHHLLAEEIIENFFKYISSQGKVATIILLSPDHFQSGILNKDKSTFTTINLESDKNLFNNIRIDKLLGIKLANENKTTFNDSAILYDHGITNLIPFIEKYLPNTRVLPILIPADISKEQIEQLVMSIKNHALPYSIMIASVDFSHYLSAQVACFHDKKSIRTLLNFEQSNFENIEVDCWQALYAIRFFAKLRGSEIPRIIDYKCANDFLDLESEETTSYFSLAYGGKSPEETTSNLSFQNKNREVKTILFTGDVMLDRGVEKLINQNNIYYPFLNILQFLRGIDIVFGNLEGPVVGEPQDYSHQSLKFAFGTESLEALSSAGFNLLSLANNHASDMGKDGFEKTKKYLKEYQIDFIGNPFYYQPNSKNVPFIAENIIFTAFNQILPYEMKDEEMINTVKEMHSLNPNKFLIISLHWGKEYQLNHSLAQQKLAHQIIESGADLIIGHHPHVVQNIEKYKEKIIFYSLGNFIFDQYFSKETQQGLAVGLEIYPDELVFNLFPLQIDRSRPALMAHDSSNEFLMQLAKRSDKQLVEEIERGIIKIKRR